MPCRICVILIDGVDGLASGLGILYCLFFSLWFLFMQMYSYSIIGFAVVGALTVFFLYNVFGRSKRKIFMGDSGSLLIGYIKSFFAFILIGNKKTPIPHPSR